MINSIFYVCCSYATNENVYLVGSFAVLLIEPIDYAETIKEETCKRIFEAIDKHETKEVFKKLVKVNITSVN